MSEAVLDPPAPNGSEPPAWRTDTRGRDFVAARGRSGVVYRQGEESLEDAFARDAKGPKDRPPKKRPAAKKPPAPTQVDMKALEFALAEALATPAMIAAMQGDEWAAQHFATQAPVVARNLVNCAQHNPWLHEKLLAAMTGEGVFMNAMVFMSLGAAVFSYVVPPIVYYLNPPFLPDRAGEMIREKYAMPERRIEEGPLAAPEAPAVAPPAAAAAPV